MCGMVMALAAIPILGATAASSASCGDIALGTIDLDKGTVCVFVNSVVFPNTARGDLRNSLGSGEAISDLTVVVRRKGQSGSQPTVTDVTVTNGEDSSSIDPPEGGDGAVADFPSGSGSGSFPGSIGGQATAEISIDVAQAAGSPDTEFCFTPSLADKPHGSGGEANVLETFEFDEGTDLIRNTISSMWRDRLAFYVTNVDERFEIDQLDGMVTLPAGSSAAIASVHLQDPTSNYAEPPGTEVSIDGTSFSIAGFAAPGGGRSYEVVVVFSQTFSGDMVKVQMEATFQ